MKFTLEIKLGNAMMQTGEDIATALREVAESVESFYSDTIIQDDYSGRAFDLNGNTVGRWQVSE